MTKNKITKRALIVSLISLLLCTSMLLGTTIAWFTDTASTSVNKIEAGNLNIDLVNESGASIAGQTVGFIGADADTKWEPGSRYQLEKVGLKNNGSLNAKYKLVVNAVIGDVDLSKVIDVYEGETKLGTLDSFINKTYGIKEGVIAPGETLYFGDITLVMQQTAGNEYQGMKIDNIAITVYATQATVESDSVDNLYDSGAIFPGQVVVSSQDALNELLVSNEKNIDVVLASGTYNFTDVVIQNKNVTFNGTKDTVFDMSSQVGVNGVPDMTDTTIVFNGVTVKWSTSNDGYQGVKNPAKVVYKNCTIEGTQFMYSDADFINCTFITGSSYAVYTRASGNYTFTNCTFTTGGRAIMMYNDAPINVNIKLTNCTFSDDGTYTSKDKAVVETGDSGAASVFNIEINKCKITKGFETNNSTSALWGNKDNMPNTRLNVVIDGKDVF